MESYEELVKKVLLRVECIGVVAVDRLNREADLNHGQPMLLETFLHYRRKGRYFILISQAEEIKRRNASS